jgi:hypothetical protein
VQVYITSCQLSLSKALTTNQGAFWHLWQVALWLPLSDSWMQMVRERSVGTVANMKPSEVSGTRASIQSVLNICRWKWSKFTSKQMDTTTGQDQTCFFKCCIKLPDLFWVTPWGPLSSSNGMSSHATLHQNYYIIYIWLVVSNMKFMTFHIIIGNLIIPSD